MPLHIGIILFGNADWCWHILRQNWNISPDSWLLPKDYNAYPAGSIPSIRRNAIIAACLDVANLMERGGTGFQTMIESYKFSPDEIQPVVSIYPGFWIWDYMTGYIGMKL